MKKLFIITALIFLFITILKAENPTPLSIGVKAGYTYSDLATVKSLTRQDALNTIKSEASGGSVFGIYARFSGDKFYFQPELSYVTQNSDFSNLVGEATSPYRGEVKMTTLNVPLQLGYKLINLPTVKLRLFFGPSASIKIDNKFKFKDNVDALTDIAKDDFNSLNWSIYSGVGVDVSKLNLDLTYIRGITDISETYFKKSGLFTVTLGFAIF